MSTTPPIWKIRAVKSYPEAHNHLLIGRVVDRDAMCVTLHCRSFHFGRNVQGPRDVVVGGISRRLIPWGRIEIINELPEGFDYQTGKLTGDGEGQVLFGNDRTTCPIADRRDRRY